MGVSFSTSVDNQPTHTGLAQVDLRHRWLQCSLVLHLLPCVGHSEHSRGSCSCAHSCRLPCTAPAALAHEHGCSLRAGASWRHKAARLTASQPSPACVCCGCTCTTSCAAMPLHDVKSWINAARSNPQIQCTSGTAFCLAGGLRIECFSSARRGSLPVWLVLREPGKSVGCAGRRLRVMGVVAHTGGRLCVWCLKGGGFARIEVKATFFLSSVERALTSPLGVV